MLPEEFFLGDVAADPFASGNNSLTGDCLPDGVSRATWSRSLGTGWLTLTGNLGETLRCLPWKGFCGAVMEFRCVEEDLEGEDGSDGNVPGAAESRAPVLAGFGPVGVGGSTSRGGLFEVCDSFLECDPAMFSGCASSFFVSPPSLCGELAPCIPRPWASGFCSVLSSCLLSLSPFARGVSTASSNASYAGSRLAFGRCFGIDSFRSTHIITYRLFCGRLILIPQLHLIAHIGDA